jgi:hypothetical protein
LKIFAPREDTANSEKLFLHNVPCVVGADKALPRRPLRDGRLAVLSFGKTFSEACGGSGKAYTDLKEKLFLFQEKVTGRGLEKRHEQARREERHDT